MSELKLRPPKEPQLGHHHYFARAVPKLFGAKGLDGIYSGRAARG